MQTVTVTNGVLLELTPVGPSSTTSGATLFTAPAASLVGIPESPGVDSESPLVGIPESLGVDSESPLVGIPESLGADSESPFVGIPESPLVAPAS